MYKNNFKVVEQPKWLKHLLYQSKHYITVWLIFEETQAKELLSDKIMVKKKKIKGIYFKFKNSAYPC